jgi:hypothetical protein
MRKKAEGNPSFPNPALEMGVAKYPTPLVPNYNDKTGGWGVNDQGHIILVEKVRIEKGNFTPQPLDGSVIYSGRDANKWPSTLYLVSEQPTEDGQHIYRYWANDRSLTSQDKWNYGIDYSANNSSYQITTRTYIVPRSQYSPVGNGSTDPNFGGKIVEQKMIELPEDNPLRSRYVAVQRTYEPVPGPSLPGKSIGEFGKISTEKQVVDTGSDIPTPSVSTIKLNVNPIDSVKAEYSLAQYDSPSTLTGYQYDPDLNLIITNTKQLVSAGAALSTANGLISSRDEPIDVWKTVRIQSRISSLPASRTEYKTGAYASPNLITAFTVTSAQMPNWDINLVVTPVMRAKRSYQTVFKHITSYQYTQPSEPAYALFDPISINVYYDGYFFKLNIPDSLTNPNLAISFSTANDDPVHGYVNETYNVPESETTATQYKNKVGTFQRIAYEIDYWKADIWRKTEQWVLIK